MDVIDYVVIGAGVSGLAFANAIRTKSGPLPSVLVLERDSEPGGYCKTVEQDGFVWDYSGHFFHFKQPAIEAWLRERMVGEEIVSVVKQSKIRCSGVDVEFPFQRNIIDLPKPEFARCLVDLYQASLEQQSNEPVSFLAMLYSRYGREITELFLRPYNEKLYACDLNRLDSNAMGRFFPQTNFAEVMATIADRASNDRGYNATFTYPRRGAIRYIHALLRDLPPSTVALGEAVIAINLEAKTVTTTKRVVRYGTLVSSAPLPRLLASANVATWVEPSVFSSNQVLVFNLGFDRKGNDQLHWMYFPNRERSFYRIGWYDNIIASDRMSLYVEIGQPSGATFDLTALRERVVADLVAEGVVTNQRLVSWHSVVMNPAYCHISRASSAAVAHARAKLKEANVYSIGRYGGWTYCSIEDNIIEARRLASSLLTQ